MVRGPVLSAVGTEGCMNGHRPSGRFHSSREASMFHKSVVILSESG